ncbi:TPA: hypothetical protein ACOEP1_004512 [Enterobacter kobei]|nr:hypothetical protein [Enterobacter kobei]CAE7591934.1 hypothetical protein AI2762V1_1180 [Enterobacter cloacae]CAH3572540.1 hypothetical protein AI2762V1_1180 [Enterobacter cloacae]CZX72935.1 Uncharacterised protein [Enterobacter kobei]
MSTLAFRDMTDEQFANLFKDIVNAPVNDEQETPNAPDDDRQNRD